MDECIRRKDAVRIIIDSTASESRGPVWAMAKVRELSAEDVRPVVRGRWILDSDPGEPWRYVCDQCGEVTKDTCMGKPRAVFCQMCGADMREDE